MLPDPQINYADLAYARSNCHFITGDVGAFYFFHRLPTIPLFHARIKAQAAVESYLGSATSGIPRFSNGATIFIYDFRRRTVFAFSDNEGMRQLYYRRTPKGITISFSLLGTSRTGSLALEEDALKTYLELDYIPAPLTVFRGVFKTSPGIFIKVKNGVLTLKHQDGFLSFAAAHLKTVRSNLRAALQGAIKVPGLDSIGLFLSGGLDSTLLCHLAAKSYRKVFTFTMSCLPFNEKTVIKSREVAEHYGCIHKEVPLGIKDYVSIFPQTAGYLSEPLFNRNIPILHWINLSAPTTPPCLLYGWGGDEMFGDRLQPDFSGRSPKFSRLAVRTNNRQPVFLFYTIKAPGNIDAFNSASRPFARTVLFPYLSPDVSAFGINLIPKLRQKKLLLKSIEPSVMTLRPITNRENSYEFLTIARNIAEECYRREIMDSPVLKQVVGKGKVARLLDDRSFNSLKLIVLHYWLKTQGGHIS